MVQNLFRRKGKINKTDAKKIGLPPVDPCSFKGCLLVGCARIYSDVSMQEPYRGIDVSGCTNTHYTSHDEGRKFLLSMLQGHNATRTHSIFERRKPLQGVMGGCVWCRTVKGRHQGPKHDQFYADVGGNSLCPEFEVLVAYLRM